MARGTVRKRGKTWGFQIPDGRHPDGRRRYIVKAGFRTQREAQQALTAVLQQLGEKTYVEPTNMTVTEYLQEWLTAVSATIRPTTLRLYRSELALYIIPAFGHTSCAI